MVKKMNNVFSRITVPALGIFFMILAGCGTTQPSKFYLLSPESAAAGEKQNGSEGMALGIGPIAFPNYLDRPQMVIRTSPNGMRLAEFERWAEPLKDNFERALMQNLSHLLSTNRMTRFLGQVKIPLDYRVALEVVRFEGEPGGKVVLEARWIVFNGKDKAPLLMMKTTLRKPWEDGKDYEALAAAMSEALADLSKEVAETVKKVAASDAQKAKAAE
jgi:uncharacterized lipoprotein YmbA